MEFAVIVVYDISDDRLRRDVELICKGFGMAHVQRSLFVGFMREERRRALYNELVEAVKKRGGEELSIRIYRLSVKEYQKLMKIGKLEEFDDDPEPYDAIVG